MSTPVDKTDLNAVFDEITNIDTARDSLASINSEGPLILNDIFDLLTDMLQTLQKAAIVQANRIRIMTVWQSVYTNMLGQVPIFTSGDGTTFGTEEVADTIIGDGESDRDVKVRDEANKIRGDQNSNSQAFTEFLRGERSVVADEAKTLQTAVNQSNDAVTQQANMATSLIQQLSTILQSIFK